MLDPRPTHVLFDLDGVLLDTEPLYTEATQAVVGRFGKTFDWTLKQHLIGRDALASARTLIDALGLPLSAEEFLAERGPVLDRLLEAAPERAGAASLVRELAARGIPMAVATSSTQALCAKKLAPHAWFSLFRAIVYGDDPRVAHRKPAPDIFLAAARDLSAEPASCLVFEDAPAGVEAALAAGMRVVALPDPALDRSLVARAHRVVSDFAALDLDDLGL